MSVDPFIYKFMVTDRLVELPNTIYTDFFPFYSPANNKKLLQSIKASTRKMKS
jgi:hypothetical protein